MRKIRKPLKLIKQEKKIDFWIGILSFFLCLFGLLMIYEASNVTAFADFGDKYHYVKEQLQSLVMGTVIFLITLKIHYKRYYVLALPVFLITLLLLIAVMIPGLGVKALGANRWLNLGIIRLQPSELAKIAVIIYLSSWFSNYEKRRFFSFLTIFLIIIGLIIVQPDLGTAIILSSIFILLYFLSGAPIWQFILIIPSSLVAVIVLAITSPYRFARLTTFLNPQSDPLGSSYHIRQILIALGSGGFIKFGLGASIQKYQYLPEATTDSIFAIIGEEFGFIGSVVFILLYIMLLCRVFNVARHAPDKLSFLLAGGVFILLASQIIINLGSMVVLFPLTGVPLPFVSYGGSNLLVSLIAVGIVTNISRYISYK